MKKNITLLVVLFLVTFFLVPNGFTKEKNDEKRPPIRNKIDKQNIINTTTDSKTEPQVSSDASPTITNAGTNNTIITTSTNSSMTGEQIKWQVLSSGGTSGSSTNFMVKGSLGQTATGLSSSTNFQVYAGYWQNFVNSSGSCCFDVRGNVDNNPNPDVAGVAGVDIADLVYLVAYSFAGGPAPICTEESDIDASGGAIPIDIADLVYLVNFMFGGGPAPANCT